MICKCENRETQSYWDSQPFEHQKILRAVAQESKRKYHLSIIWFDINNYMFAYYIF